jgi:hypothetical protein
VSDVNLILIYRDVSSERDFEEIARKVIALAPEITVYHLPSRLKAELPVSAWAYPTLTVSMDSQFRIPVRRGPVLTNIYISKLDQAKRVREAGLPVPPIKAFKPGMTLDPVLFGEFVVIKPMTLTSTGKGVQLFRRRRLERTQLSDFPPSHPIHHDREGYLVQRFIDTGDYPAWNRVISFFAKPIYAVHGSLKTPRPPLGASDQALESATIAIQASERQRRWTVEQDVLDLAAAIGNTFCELPLLAIDMLRDVKTGQLHFLECNAGGNTWHFSSTQPGGISLRHELGEADCYGPEIALELGRQRMIEQFNGFDVVAQALVERTRRLAS